MAILGVLLGITMTVLAWLVREFIATRNARDVEVSNLTERVTFLEKRKALLAEAVTSQPKPTGVAGPKLRTWNEDAAPAEAVTR